MRAQRGSVMRFFDRRRMAEAGGNHPRRQKKRAAAALLILLLSAGGLHAELPSLRIVFLDVGQGDCALVQSGDRAVLIDCGSSSAREVWQYRAAPCLKYFGISRVDAAALSHGDSDHICGIEEWIRGSVAAPAGRIFSGIAVAGLCVGAGAAKKDEGLERVCQLALEAGLPVEELSPGDAITWQGSGVSLQCLYPGEEGRTGDPNQDSMVLLLRSEKHGISVLFTGDLEKEGEERFTKTAPLDGFTGMPERILKAGHHGSRFATLDALLERLEATGAVISCGRGNRYGHPAQTMLKRLSDHGVAVWRTDLQGARVITFA